ncbi:hypothetical protein C8A00DRAFT_33663 [Chaetomidium leptoderma]|uniref:N-acetyltransferase domain-containing protein n=1 Tax=Chaetomidium leptoderma TaxID=669021 RepID=A0AAN6VL52_9PEZI|nr:hypothetical protein C8A00DRAFT_33663 [Chaetomidium leptoderma]
MTPSTPTLSKGEKSTQDANTPVDKAHDGNDAHKDAANGEHVGTHDGETQNQIAASKNSTTPVDASTQTEKTTQADEVTRVDAATQTDASPRIDPDLATQPESKQVSTTETDTTRTEMTQAAVDSRTTLTDQDLPTPCTSWPKAPNEWPATSRSQDLIVSPSWSANRGDWPESPNSSDRPEANGTSSHKTKGSFFVHEFWPIPSASYEDVDRCMEIMTRIVCMPALESNPDSLARFIFPCLGKDNGQPGGWTAEEREQVIKWWADGLSRLFKAERSLGNMMLWACESKLPVGLLTCAWEFGWESELGSKRAIEALKVYPVGGFTEANIGVPSTLDRWKWAQMGLVLNVLREGVYRDRGVPGDARICRIYQLFVDPTWWRHGVASRLMSTICPEMDRRGAYGFAFAPPSAVGFYLGFGFEHLSGVRSPFDLCCMFRDVAKGKQVVRPKDPSSLRASLEPSNTKGKTPENIQNHVDAAVDGVKERLVVLKALKAELDSLARAVVEPGKLVKGKGKESNGGDAKSDKENKGRTRADVVRAILANKPVEADSESDKKSQESEAVESNQDNGKAPKTDAAASKMANKPVKANSKTGKLSGAKRGGKGNKGRGRTAAKKAGNKGWGC